MKKRKRGPPKRQFRTTNTRIFIPDLEKLNNFKEELDIKSSAEALNKILKLNDIEKEKYDITKKKSIFEKHLKLILE